MYELQLCGNRGSGIARVNLVVGNHKSFFGITHIIDFLKKDILPGIEYEISMYPSTKHPNLIIEDFHSRHFRKQLNGSKTKNILIVTEFLSSRDSVEINQFEREPFVTYLRLAKSVLFRKAPAREFASNFRREYLPKVNSYWRERRKGLQEIIEDEIFTASLLLHPAAVANFAEFPLTHVTLFPELKMPSHDSNITNTFITMGSMTPYRRRTLELLNRELPLGVQHVKDEQLTSISNELKGLRIVDIYMRNATNWNYTSPIRISRSMSQGREVVLFDNKDFLHPIVDTCANIGNPYELSNIEERLEDLKLERASNTVKYNEEARIKNRQALQFIFEAI